MGGIITYIAKKLGVGEDQGINNIEGNNRLNIKTLINFIKHRPPMTYTLKLNVPTLFILPNPSWTKTEVEENLLYVGDGPQENEDHNQGEEEGENLHHDEEYHDHDAGGNFENERWAWMQTEVERISTEQQRQGVELSGLRNDVLRGNRIFEENNQMLRTMMQHFHLQGGSVASWSEAFDYMQHFHLQGPPYGPQ